MATNRFIFFGCWNNKGCDKGAMADPKTPLTKTIEKIGALLTPTTPQSPSFLIVAGDNYYPTDAGKDCVKKKKYDEDKLRSGFECLDELDIETFLLLGNHDVEKLGTDVEGIDPTKGCAVIEFQKGRYIDSSPTTNPKIQLFNFKGDKLMQKPVGTNTMIIMFDSTIYDFDGEEEGKKYLDCYAKILPGIESIESIRKKQAKQRDETIKQLNKDNKYTTLIFSCHHPILSARLKKGKFKEAIRKQIADFLLPFTAIKTVTKFILLCADDHLVQYSTLTISGKMTIEQYIVGTGGAELDKLEGPYEDKCDKGKVEVIGDECFTTFPITDENEQVIATTKEPKPNKGAKKDKKGKKSKKGEDIKITYDVHITESSYGFLDITVNDKEFIPTFVRTEGDKTLELPVINLSVSPKNGGGGKSRRRRLKKNKILTRKMR